MAEPDAEDPGPADQLAQACADLARDDARFLKFLPSVQAEMRAVDADRTSTRVLFARDLAAIAVYERLARIARRDVVEPAS